jgi:predicted metal-dependent HD superfamily phosphohydrolase
VVALERPQGDAASLDEVVELGVRHVRHEVAPPASPVPPQRIVDQYGHGAIMDHVSDEVELRTAWQLVADRGAADAHRFAVDVRRRSEQVFDDVVGRHREPHRRYHGVRHVVWVIRHVHELADSCGPVDLPTVIAAAFFHDAVYDARATDNEERSALLAERLLRSLGWDGSDAGAAARMIRRTAGHTAPGNEVIAADDQVLLDADLAILGADPAAYDAYVTGVRAEYGHLDAAAWTVGRSAVLQSLLARPHLYHTVAGVERWESRARANLTAELSALLGAR